jgi:hypothetical protein
VTVYVVLLCDVCLVKTWTGLLTSWILTWWSCKRRLIFLVLSSTSFIITLSCCGNPLVDVQVRYMHYFPLYCALGFLERVLKGIAPQFVSDLQFTWVIALLKQNLQWLYNHCFSAHQFPGWCIKNSMWMFFEVAIFPLSETLLYLACGYPSSLMEVCVCWFDCILEADKLTLVSALMQVVELSDSERYSCW